METLFFSTNGACTRLTNIAWWSKRTQCKGRASTVLELEHISKENVTATIQCTFGKLNCSIHISILLPEAQLNQNLHSDLSRYNVCSGFSSATQPHFSTLSFLACIDEKAHWRRHISWRLSIELETGYQTAFNMLLSRRENEHNPQIDWNFFDMLKMNCCGHWVLSAFSELHFRLFLMKFKWERVSAVSNNSI